MEETLTLEGAAERLLEDERLRRDLTDEEAQPLIDWALAQIEAAAAAGRPLVEALEQVRAAARAVNDLLATAPGPDTAARLRELAGRPAPPRTRFWQRLWRREDPVDALTRRLPSLTGRERLQAVLALLPTTPPAARR